MVRLPPGMRERLTEQAREAGRSVNAEVVARLEASFQNDEAAQHMADLVEEHENAVSDFEGRISSLEKDVSRLLDSAGLYY